MAGLERSGRDGSHPGRCFFPTAILRCPVIERLNLGEEGLVRAGCACYTTDEEVERLIQGVREIVEANRRLRRLHIYKEHFVTLFFRFV